MKYVHVGLEKLDLWKCCRTAVESSCEQDWLAVVETMDAMRTQAEQNKDPLDYQRNIDEPHSR